MTKIKSSSKFPDENDVKPEIDHKYWKCAKITGTDCADTKFDNKGFEAYLTILHGKRHLWCFFAYLLKTSCLVTNINCSSNFTTKAI